MTDSIAHTANNAAEVILDLGNGFLQVNRIDVEHRDDVTFGDPVVE